MNFKFKITLLLFLIFFHSQQSFALDLFPKNYGPTSCRPEDPIPGSLLKFCSDVDQALCKNVPLEKRRSCNDRDDSIIHSKMTASEIYTFSKGCLKSAASSFTKFFTEFVPGLCVALWDLSKEAAASVANGEVIKKLKGATEASASLFSDIYEVIKKNPGDFFYKLWDKITKAISPLIQNFECHSPAARVEKICGLVTEFVMPPALLAKVIVKGPKFAKAFLEAKKVNAANKVTPPPTPIITKASPRDIKGSPEINEFKKIYAKELILPPGANTHFMEKMKADKALKNTNVVYFEVENAVLKTLNDTVLRDKVAVDAINNSYMQKLHKNLMNNQKVKAKMDGQYKDYKSYRLRLNLKSAQEKSEYEKLLAEIYKKTNEDFIEDLAQKNITKLLPPSTGNVGSPGRWFLSGIGNNSLEANMAARASRTLSGNSKLVNFNAQTASFNTKINEISKIRNTLSVPLLLQSKIVEKLANGTIILSKPMIQILRKNPPSNFNSKEAYLAEIAKKTKEVFGTSINQKTSQDLALYFDKIDSLSPPVYATGREIIDLGKANHGIVSVDFAGIGVDNIYAQMKAVSGSKVPLNTSFNRLEASGDEVTLSMNKAKADFDKITKSINQSQAKTQFSGDDGIFIPTNKSLTIQDKTKLITELAKTSDPSKFRVTFVDTNYANGKVIPKNERSLRIVTAENIEKKTRASFTGAGKISPDQSSKIITAINYRPHQLGGEFTLIVSGKSLSSAEKKLIETSFKNSLNAKSGEKFVNVIFN